MLLAYPQHSINMPTDSPHCPRHPSIFIFLTPTHYEFVNIFISNCWPNEVKTVGTYMARRKIDENLLQKA